MRRIICLGVLLACALLSGVASAQTLTVTVDRAIVRSEASTTGAVVARVGRGAKLEVLEQVGIWYKVRIVASGKEGFIASRLVSTAAKEAPAPSPTPSARPTPATSPTGTDGTAAKVFSSSSSSQINHTLGVGARLSLGFATGIGGDVRYWFPRGKLGVGITVGRFSESYQCYDGHYDFTHTQLGAALLYSVAALPLGPTAQVRPYVGGGLNLFRWSASYSGSGTGYAGGAVGGGSAAATSGTKAGVQVFGGVELFFHSVPKLTISADYGYYRAGEPYGGLDYRVGGRLLGVTAHYYLK